MVVPHTEPATVRPQMALRTVISSPLSLQTRLPGITVYNSGSPLMSGQNSCTAGEGRRGGAGAGY